MSQPLISGPFMVALIFGGGALVIGLLAIWGWLTSEQRTVEDHRTTYIVMTVAITIVVICVAIGGAIVYHQLQWSSYHRRMPS